MSNSSQPENCITTLPELDLSNVTIVNGGGTPLPTVTLSPIDNPHGPYQYSFDTSTFTTGTITSGATVGGVSVGYTSPLTVSQISALNSWQIKETVPFEDGFPSWEDFSKMCEEYPGLQKTFEHLKVFYRLCKDEWEVTKRVKK